MENRVLTTLEYDKILLSCSKYAVLDVSKENIVDIINKSKNNEFNIEHYFEDNKVRINAYNSLIPNNINLNDQIQMDNIYQNLDKFKDNILEYEKYLQFLPVFNCFKEEFEPFLEKDIKDYKELNQIINENQKEVLSFLDSIGIYPKIKNDYYYPYSNQASSVRTLLVNEVEKRNIKIIYNSKVENITKNNNNFVIEFNDMI